MDKFDRFLRDVISKTHDDQLIWEIVSPSKHQELIFNWPYAYQAYEARYQAPGGKTYQLVLVEKKTPSTDEEFDLPREAYSSELLVIDQGSLVFTLNRNYVDADDLFELVSMVQSKNKSAKELFSQFE